jgi:3'-phosphoadenosine 5'-phosphosulfate sulfotransferase (PAPS reductase)/FAD synthetase
MIETKAPIIKADSTASTVDLHDVLANAPKNIIIQDCFTKAYSVLNKHENIVCSISGGSDSDLLIDICEQVAPGKAHYVFFDTGMEYDATKEHIEYLKERYSIDIERVTPKTPSAVAVRKGGYPVFNKTASEFIHRLQLHDFQWEDEPYEVLIKKYPKCQSALEWWCNKKKSKKFTVSNNKYLKEFLIENPPTIHISGACCTKAKKEPSAEIARKYNADLMIIGVRRAEGGARAKGNCFSGRTKHKAYDTYRMIFWFKKEDKEEYEKWYNIKHSKCYTQYGLCRTGCIGCPFGLTYGDELELEVADIYEPQKAKAARAIFKPAYDYTNAYKTFRAEKEAKTNAFGYQYSIFDLAC